jgi:hypothetical protein
MRCIGNFGEFLLTFGGLVMTRRVLHYGALLWMVIGTLVGLLPVMAADGLHSLFSDLGLWHPWTPSNALRLVTGLGVGVGLGVAMAWLLASATWHLSDDRPTVTSTRELLFTLPMLAVLAALLWWASAWLHFPLATFLVLAVWLCVTLLVLVSLLLALRIDARMREPQQRHLPAAVAAVVALGIMVGRGAARFWLERTYGISNAFM